MTTQSLLSRHRNRAQSNRQCVAAVYLMAVALLLGPIMMPAPTNADMLTDVFSSKTARLLICVLTWGQECYLSEEVIGTGEPVSPFLVTCEKPLMTGLPQFLTWPIGQARYRFQENCFSPARPGSVMTVRWEGSWNPSETKADRPNASETVEITGFDPFLPGRAPGGGKIYMHWTARCTSDPWLQSGGCTPWGAYVPDDLRQAMPDIDKQSFPRTGSVISPEDKRRLYAEYRRANPLPGERLGIQQRIPSQIVQAPTPTDTGIVQKPRSNLNIFSRGIEAMDVPQAEAGRPDQPAETIASLEREPDASPTPSITIKLDQALHFQSTRGDDILVAAGVYEIEPVLDLQLSLSKEGQPAILLPAVQGAHNESMQQAVAFLVSGHDDARHLLFLTPDGKRFDIIGSTSGIQSRGLGMVAPKPTALTKEAMAAVTSNTPELPPPPCRPNPNPFGPRWIPVPCTMPEPPSPYLDASNVLHACVNNNHGAFRLVRPTEFCSATNGEVKVKWQLVP